MTAAVVVGFGLAALSNEGTAGLATFRVHLLREGLSAHGAMVRAGFLSSPRRLRPGRHLGRGGEPRGEVGRTPPAEVGRRVVPPQLAALGIKQVPRRADRGVAPV